MLRPALVPRHQEKGVGQGPQPLPGVGERHLGPFQCLPGPTVQQVVHVVPSGGVRSLHVAEGLPESLLRFPVAAQNVEGEPLQGLAPPVGARALPGHPECFVTPMPFHPVPHPLPGDPPFPRDQRLDRVQELVAERVHGRRLRRRDPRPVVEPEAEAPDDLVAVPPGTAPPGGRKKAGPTALESGLLPLGTGEHVGGVHLHRNRFRPLPKDLARRRRRDGERRPQAHHDHQARSGAGVARAGGAARDHGHGVGG